MSESRVLDYLRTHPHAQRTHRWLVWSLAAIRGDLGGQPETATSAEVLRDPRKLQVVAKRVHDELVGLEESQRRVDPLRKLTPVAERFPGGYRELEAHVLASCRDSPGERPFSATWTRLARELGSY
jgi:hypothetical protein